MHTTNERTYESRFIYEWKHRRNERCVARIRYLSFAHVSVSSELRHSPKEEEEEEEEEEEDERKDARKSEEEEEKKVRVKVSG